MTNEPEAPAAGRAKQNAKKLGSDGLCSGGMTLLRATGLSSVFFITPQRMSVPV